MPTSQESIAMPVDRGAVGCDVRLTRSGQELQVEPPCLDILHVLRTRVRVLVTPPGGPSVVVTLPITMYRKDDEIGAPVPQYPAGLELAVRRLLERAGRKVRYVRVMEVANRTRGVVDPPPNHLPPPAAAPFGTFPLDTLMLDCVRRCERATIRYDPMTVEPASLIAQVARAWPRRTILVLAARRSDVYGLRRRLRRCGIHAHAVMGSDSPRKVGRVVVATYVGMAHPSIRPEWRHIVFALDAVEAVGRKAFLGPALSTCVLFA